MNKLEIYGTLGPSCCHKEMIKKLLQAGMTGMRLNLSHCNLWDRKDWIDEFHEACKELSIKAELMIDMRGPELRVNALAEPIHFINQSTVKLDKSLIPLQVIQAAEANDLLLLDDGKIKLKVTDCQTDSLLCSILHGGLLTSRKSIAIQGKSIKGQVLTESDLANLKEAQRFGVTSIMQPFVSSKEDLMLVRETLNQLNLDQLRIFAKIENMDGVKCLPELIEACDQIVIARGDLGNACGLIQLPVIQKRIENTCRIMEKPYMVVTEMLYSMQEKPTPSRAEVSDIFHAVYQGASSIMLTGETASGKYPYEAMFYFAEVAKAALKERKRDNELLD